MTFDVKADDKDYMGTLYIHLSHFLMLTRDNSSFLLTIFQVPKYNFAGMMLIDDYFLEKPLCTI